MRDTGYGMAGARTRLASLLMIAGLVGACAASPTPQTEAALPATSGLSGGSIPSLPAFESSGHEGLDAWRADFAERALADGRDPLVVYNVLRGVKPLRIYLRDETVAAANAPSSALAEQAEFAKPVWEYLRTAVSDGRKSTGAREVGRDETLFRDIEAEYGVDRHVVAAIWGMETNFGGFIGDFDGPETLANMATEGRRRDLAEAELLATMRILEGGYATRDQLVAGWAGAMGQTQFMPSTYLAHAVDFSGDGQRDVWASRSDALASAANYLRSVGYVADEPWGLEVRVPDGFDYGLSDGRRMTVSNWQGRGLRAVSGASLPEALAGGRARLWLPAGAQGPKYLLFKNFDVFLTYNRSNSYAFAVGLLADAIGGQDGPVTPWPTGLAVLSVAEVKELQAGLNALGFDAGGVDGVVGNGTRAALRRFQVSRGLLADGYPTTTVLAAVRAEG